MNKELMFALSNADAVACREGEVRSIMHAELDDIADARPPLRDAHGSGGKAGEKRRKNGGLSTDTGIIRQESLMLSQLRMP